MPNSAIITLHMRSGQLFILRAINSDDKCNNHSVKKMSEENNDIWRSTDTDFGNMHSPCIVKRNNLLQLRIFDPAYQYQTKTVSSISHNLFVNALGIAVMKVIPNKITSFQVDLANKSFDDDIFTNLQSSFYIVITFSAYQ